MYRILFACLVAALASAAQANLVWSKGAAPGALDTLWDQTNPSSLSLSGTGTGTHGETGTVFSAASLGDGTLKVSVSSTRSGNFLGGALGIAGLSADIFLNGPSAVPGLVAVTMTFDGLYGGPGDNASNFNIFSGLGFGGRGFATNDPTQTGVFSLLDFLSTGQALQKCTNCSYLIDDNFLISVTAYLPFAAGAHSVNYAAQILLSTQGRSFIDGSHTATFSIAVPDGFTYSSELAFTNAVIAVPEPGIFSLMALGLFALGGMKRLARNRR